MVQKCAQKTVTVPFLIHPDSPLDFVRICCLTEFVNLKTTVPIPSARAGLFVILFVVAAPAQQTNLGVFENQSDIGATRRAGSSEYDATRRAYTISGGGENMWFTNDAFHF